MCSKDHYLDQSESSSFFNPLDAKIDKELINQQLYSFLKSTNLEMDYDIFCALVDLLRAGVCPEALYVCFCNLIPLTKVGRKLGSLRKTKKTRKETGGDYHTSDKG